MATKTENPNAFKALADALSALDGTEARVGWFEAPVAYVAAIQELGSPANNIPARSFFRSTYMKKESEWRELAAKLSAQVLAGKMSARDAMQMIAAQAESDVANTISTLTSPPLSPITLGARKYRAMGKQVTGSTIGEIAAKLKDGTLDVSGVSTKPLVDTAIMVNSLTHKVKG